MSEEEEEQPQITSNSAKNNASNFDENDPSMAVIQSDLQPDTIQEGREGEGLIKIKPCPISSYTSSKLVTSRENNRQLTEDGSEVRRRHSRKFSHLGQTATTDKSIDEARQNPSISGNKQRVEYDVVKSFLVKAYTDQCIEEGEMELVQIPTKRSSTRKRGKKTPIKVESIIKEEMKQRQLNNVFQYTIVDNKKKRQEIKIKQRLVRDFSIDPKASEMEGLADNSYQEQIPTNRLQQKSQSFHTQSKNDVSQTNLNTTNIQQPKDKQELIIVEDSYPLEWDPGFNKKVRKKLDLINQTRSNNTLPLLDLSNAKNLEKYKHILKSKQGWQPLLNTPFLPISPTNQVTKADLFKNLLKEKKSKFSKSKNGSRIRGRLKSLQNEWSKYSKDNNNSNNNMSEILNYQENYLIQEANIENENENEEIDHQQDPSQKGVDEAMQQSINQKSPSQLQKYKVNRNKKININTMPSKVSEVNESSFITSDLKSSSFTKQTFGTIKQLNSARIDEIDVINERIGEMMQMIPKMNNNQKIQQPQSRDSQTANGERPSNQSNGRNLSSKQQPNKFNTLENQTTNNFYSIQSGEKQLKTNYFNKELQKNSVSKSYDFYNSIVHNPLSKNNNNKQLIVNNSNNRLTISNYSTINQVPEESIQQYNEEFYTNQPSEIINQQAKSIHLSSGYQQNEAQQNIQEIRDTVKIDKLLQNKQPDGKKKVMYISYQDQKMLTEGNVPPTDNPDLQQTIKMQEILIQEQRLQQQLSILRSQGERAGKLDQNFYKENDEIDNFKLRKTPQRFDRRNVHTPLSRNNYCTPLSSGNKIQVGSSNYNNFNQNHLNNSFNTISNHHLNNGNTSLTHNKSIYNQSTLTVSNSNNQYNDQSALYAGNSQFTLNKTNKQFYQQQQNMILSQNKSPITGKRILSTSNRQSSKSPIDKTMVNKDNLTPHQMIYIQQGHLSNQILNNKLSQNYNPNLPGSRSTATYKDINPNQTFSTESNPENQSEQPLTLVQETQIAQLQQQFDQIIKSGFSKPKKGYLNRKYVQQSMI